MPLNHTPIVLKFGGSSVGSPARFKRIVDVVTAYRKAERLVVIVVSALGGVTDLLVEATAGPVHAERCRAALQRLYVRHRMHAAAVLSLRSQRRFGPVLHEQLREIDARWRIQQPDGNVTPAARDAILATGERLATHLLALALSDTGLDGCPTDAAGLILTDDVFGRAGVERIETTCRIRRWYRGLPAGAVPVVTGFIGATTGGRTTTLGRGGSDYSAALIATALDADRLERWTDVDGVYTSDPNKNPDARKLERIIMSDALAWNRAGMMGIHRKTLDPLMEASIPMYVRSIDTPEDPGTAIIPRCHRLAMAC